MDHSTPLLAAPILGTPANGATGISRQPAFSWSQVSGNYGYRIVVSTNVNDLTTDPARSGILSPANGFNTTVSQGDTGHAVTDLTPTLQWTAVNGADYGRDLGIGRGTYDHLV